MTSTPPSDQLGLRVLDQDCPRPGGRVRPRVAMFVLNPCHNDARVRKEAASLSAAGFDVRIFALGNRQWPHELVVEDGFTIQRVEVVSVYQRSLARLGSTYRWLSSGSFRGMRPISVLAAALLAPVLALLWLDRWLLGLLPGPRKAEGVSATTAEASDQIPSLTRRGIRWLRSFAHRGVRLLRRAARLARMRARRAVRQTLRSGYLQLHRLLRRALIRFHRPSVMLQFWRSAAGLAVAWEPDIAHGHDLNALPAAAWVARATGARLVYDSHELWRRRNRSGEFRPLARLVDGYQERRLIRRADLVITVSGSIGTWLQRTYRLAEPPMILRNLPTRVEPRQGPSLRALAGLADERILLYTGRITSGRGIEDALVALPRLPPDVTFVMLGYGDAEYVRSLDVLIARHGIADRVREVPAVAPHEVAAVAAQATMALVAIQPLCLSYRYALPNKLFEAIQAGLPVLASDLPDMAAVVTQHRCGELFPADDADALVAAAHKILADPDPYRCAARAAAAQLHWATESGLLTDAYRDLIATTVPR